MCSLGSTDKLPGFSCQLDQSLTLLSWASYSNFLCLSFPTCKIETPASQAHVGLNEHHVMRLTSRTPFFCRAAAAVVLVPQSCPTL